VFVNGKVCASSLRFLLALNLESVDTLRIQIAAVEAEVKIESSVRLVHVAETMGVG
jgi:hypothetical protein